MHSSFISAAILAFASTVFASNPTSGFDAITLPFQGQNVPAGQPFDIVWAPSKDYSGTVTIQLLQGATPGTLSAGVIIKAGVDSTAGTYTWDVPSSLTYFATYGLSITQENNSTRFQYSCPFHITGLSGSSSYPVNSGTISTVTMHLSTGSNYVASSTIASNSTSSFATPTPSSNVTLSHTISRTTASNTPYTQASATSGSSSSSISTPPSSPTGNAAVAQVATGSLAMIGGLVLALAL
ncbi:hypothetical protein N431DRAFT_490919 [Stipitochalara longipes BDJ]|nr:hypothetical protein N431DRAFT_490919 [Stipitochalara longipes BDJ]